MDNNYNYNDPGMGSEEPKKGFAIAALILGIVGLLAWCLPILGYPVGIAGIILGILGIKKSGMKGMSIAGLIMSCVCILASVANSIAGIAVALSNFNY